MEAQESVPGSTLNFYRQALELRGRLQAEEKLEWIEGGPDVVAFRRPGDWVSVTNFGSEPAPLPAGRVLLSSGVLDGSGVLPPDTSVWLQED